jgi:hypothetical protein
MKRADLEHVLRASKDITGETEFIVLDSQSLLGPYPHAPSELCVSMEVDLYPKNRPELAMLIEGSLGELSQFHGKFGYYADGVTPETAKLPHGWADRVVRVSNENTRGAIGWCLDPHDLAFSKLAARREKDLRFVAGLLRHKLIRLSFLEALIESADSPELREKLEEALATCRQK